MSEVAPGLVDVLTLERIEADLFRSSVVYEDAFGLYGGQVAAQAPLAAAETVPAGRHPHSLHGYFLSRGDPSRRVLLMVNRDRDGRSYSNRRVIAVQNGVVIFNMAASFHVTEDGPDYQAHAMPVAAPPGLPGRTRMLGIEIRVPEQPIRGQEWPSRVWMRTRDLLADEITHACALTYVSDCLRHVHRSCERSRHRSGRSGDQHRPRGLVPPPGQAGRVGTDGPAR